LSYNDYTPAGYIEDDSQEVLREIRAMARERIAKRQDERIARLYADRQQEQQTPSEDHRTWSYYEELRKKDRAKYLDPKTQSQMFKDAQELGNAFKDGSFESLYTGG
jgi:hypothetical protein